MSGSSRMFVYRLRRELRHGVLPIWILETLAQGPLYGYALLKLLREREEGVGSVSPSMLYSALARLKGFGLLRSYHGRESRGPIRKYYELTSKGREVLPAIRELQAALRPARWTAIVQRPPAARGAATRTEA